MTVQEETTSGQLPTIHTKRQDGSRPGPYARKPDWIRHAPHPDGPKIAQHRRGVSLDETRAHQSGLVGVDAPLNASASHRRVSSHNNPATAFYPRYSGSAYTTSTTAANSSNPSSQSAKTPHPEVKFVNSTVEALEDQIRKEDAPKKKRTRTTPEQLRILQKAFNADPMPNSGTRVALAKKLGMNARAVQVWFQNRRAKAKLEAKRADSGRSSSGADSPSVMMDECEEYEHAGHHQQQELASFDPGMMSYRATNRSLKATGMVGRMAFPPDLDYLHAYNNHHSQMRPSYHQSVMSRSFSLPFIDISAAATTTIPYSDVLCEGDDGMSSNGLLPRADSTQFAPYEFASGSHMNGFGDGVDGSALGGRGGLARCQSLPVDNYVDDTAVGLVDLLPPMDDSVWPSIVGEDSFPGNSASSKLMRRSFSLPNVYQPDFMDMEPGELSNVVEYSRSSSPHPDYLSVVDPLAIDHPTTTNSHHRRSRSHSISHNPDYPENLNDFLTTGVPSYDD